MQRVVNRVLRAVLKGRVTILAQLLDHKRVRAAKGHGLARGQHDARLDRGVVSALHVFSLAFLCALKGFLFYDAPIGV